MLSHRPLHRYTYAEYVELERSSPTKHEFLDGEIAIDEIYRRSAIA